eukprot:CAMPEP_0171135050 /NCGR_PEP_ID=MMETSP0766_2-20121228/129136_1 /TAXON_ID=439317 /ORGANISM="Gambierdiscus australes, Strain CAWD 149" /LENGTH=48 /DNA_ID= /DNA_START= /DNA_END= /DNA_ORIENTATION=
MPDSKVGEPWQRCAALQLTRVSWQRRLLGQLLQGQQAAIALHFRVKLL